MRPSAPSSSAASCAAGQAVPWAIRAGGSGPRPGAHPGQPHRAAVRPVQLLNDLLLLYSAPAARPDDGRPVGRSVGRRRRCGPKGRHGAQPDRAASDPRPGPGPGADVPASSSSAGGDQLRWRDRGASMAAATVLRGPVSRRPTRSWRVRDDRGPARRARVTLRPSRLAILYGARDMPPPPPPPAPQLQLQQHLHRLHEHICCRCRVRATTATATTTAAVSPSSLEQQQHR